MQGIDSPRSTPAPDTQRRGRRGSSGTQPLSNKPVKRKHTFWWYVKWIFITIQLALFCAIVVTLSIGYGLYNRLAEIVPDTRSMTRRAKAEPTIIYAADGSVLAELKGDVRRWVPIEELKVSRKRNGVMRKEAGRLISATVSVEDARFYIHPGMDAKRIVGAALANYRSGSVEQGGSTITEQLAKNVYLTRTKTLSRRLQTALLALQLERRFTKDEILELYLNEIFYGNRAYGCEAAAQTYFDKSAKDLSISEASFLAGLPQQPANLDPFQHFDRAKKRQRVVLHEMLQNHAINYNQYLQAIKDPSVSSSVAKAKLRFIREHSKTQKWRSPYFVSYVKQYLQQRYQMSEEYLNKAGLKIYTTIDPKIQTAATEIMNRRLENLGSSSLQGALVCIDPWTGHILAMYGGRNYYDTQHNGQWNRAVQGKRQPGSSFKPYIYATAMEMGFTPESRVKDRTLRVLGYSEVKRGGHEIRNYDRTHHGTMTLRTAIATSNNVAATRLLLKIGLQSVIQKAHLMGIQSPLVPVPTLALGTSEVSPLEHVSAFGVFATRGLRAEPTPVERVENYAGETLMEHAHPVRGARVLSTESGNAMWDVLRSVVTSGTGKNAAIPGVEVIGKTGTTSSNKDVWFMGATKQIVTGVWIGYDRPKPLSYGSAGGKWCAPAWRSFTMSAMEVLSHRNPIERLVEDARATREQLLRAAQYKRFVQVRICRENGALATAACPDTYISEFSAAGGAPTQYCDIHPNRRQKEPVLGDSKDTAAGDNPGDLGYNGDNPPAATLPPDMNNPDTGDDGAAPDAAAPDDGAPDGGAAPADPERGAALDDAAAPRGRRVALRTGQAPAGEEPPLGTTEGSEVVATVCAESGDLATRRCPVTVQRFFLASQVPRRSCKLH